MRQDDSNAHQLVKTLTYKPLTLKRNFILQLQTHFQINTLVEMFVDMGVAIITSSPLLTNNSFQLVLHEIIDIRKVFLLV